MLNVPTQVVQGIRVAVGDADAAVGGQLVRQYPTQSQPRSQLKVLFTSSKRLQIEQQFH